VKKESIILFVAILIIILLVVPKKRYYETDKITYKALTWEYNKTSNISCKDNQSETHIVTDEFKLFGIPVYNKNMTILCSNSND